MLLLLICVATFATDEMFEGEHVVPLTDDSFEETVFNGKWLVKFYAPWCGHCKHLAPIWDEAAQAVEGIVSFAKIDCTIHSTVCGKYSVKGYPSLKYFQNGMARDYKGGRDLEHIIDYARMVSGVPVTRVTMKDIDHFAKKPKTKFIYFSDDNRLNDETYEEVADDYIAEASFGISLDEALRKEVDAPSPPSMVAIKADGFASVSFNDALLNKTKVSQFVEENKLPILAQLTLNNAFEYTDNERMTVLTVVNPSKQGEMKKALKELREIAEEHYATYLFAWIDGLRWESFAERFDITPDQYPRSFVWHPKAGYHYEDVGVQTKEDLIAYMHAIADGTISPQGAGKGFFSDFYKAYYAIIGQAKKYPFIFGGAVLFIVAACTFCCCFADFDDTEPTPRPKAIHSQITRTRKEQ